MSNVLHPAASTLEVHSPYRWKPPNAAARILIDVGATNADDVGCMALQLDDKTVWTAVATGTGAGAWAAVATAAELGAALAARNMIAGTGLTGGGTLAADRTFAVSYGSGAGTAAQGNDSRLSDARTPTAHASTHATAGTDPVSPSSIGATPDRGVCWRNEITTGLTLGTTQPLSLADSIFVGKSVQATPNIMSTTPTSGVAAGSFSTSGAEAGTSTAQGGLGSSAASGQPYNSTDFPGYRRTRVAILKIDDDDLMLSDIVPATTGADAMAPVYGYLSFRSDLGTNAKWRLWFYYRRNADGLEVSVTPTVSVVSCKLYIIEVIALSQLPGLALLGMAISGQLPAEVFFGSVAGSVCQGNDSRLSDSRNPTPVTTTAGFTQPAPNATVTVSMTSTLGLLVNRAFSIVSSFYNCDSITDSTHAVFRRTGVDGEAATGATIAGGSSVLFAGGLNFRVTNPTAGAVTWVVPACAYQILDRVIGRPGAGGGGGGSGGGGGFGAATVGTGGGGGGGGAGGSGASSEMFPCITVVVGETLTITAGTGGAGGAGGAAGAAGGGGGVGGAGSTGTATAVQGSTSGNLVIIAQGVSQLGAPGGNNASSAGGAGTGTTVGTAGVGGAAPTVKYGTRSNPGSLGPNGGVGGTTAGGNGGTGATNSANTSAYNGDSVAAKSGTVGGTGASGTFGGGGGGAAGGNGGVGDDYQYISGLGPVSTDGQGGGGGRGGNGTTNANLSAGAGGQPGTYGRGGGGGGGGAGGGSILTTGGVGTAAGAGAKGSDGAVMLEGRFA